MHRILFLPDIRPDIQLGNLVSGRIPDLKKGRIPDFKKRPDIWCIPMEKKVFPNMKTDFLAPALQYFLAVLMRRQLGFFLNDLFVVG
jgi:hypothetical protein